MNTLQYGIIGCGVIGPVHAHALSLLPQARLVEVCDIDRERAEAMAAKFGAERVSTDYHALLGRADIDAVCICLPHYLHAEVAIAAAQAGKHILCEKPMAIDPADMDAMMAAADEAGVQLGICFQHRFDPQLMQIKAAIDEGKFGQLLLGGAQIRCLRDRSYYDSAAWRGTWRYEGGGVLINQGIHYIDQMLWMLGDAISVTGSIATLQWGEFIEVEDTASAIIQFANGAQGHISATSASPLNWQTRLQVYGSTGSVEVNAGAPHDFAFFSLVGDERRLLSREEAQPAEGKACYGNSHINALASFTDCVLNDIPFPVSGREGRRAAELVLGVYRSAQQGRPVALPLAAELTK